VKIVYTDEAKSDVETAFSWYELKRTGLGLEFLFHLEMAIEQILDFPEACECCHNSFRRKITKKFPFSLFYTIEKNLVVVHAVFDNRQDPEKGPDKV